MTAIAKDQLKPYALGHLGLAGAFIRECGLIDKIDSLIPKDSNNAGHFTHGQVVALMILNGLGYTTRPLYMSNTYVQIRFNTTVFRTGLKHHEYSRMQGWQC